MDYQCLPLLPKFLKVMHRLTISIDHSVLLLKQIDLAGLDAQDVLSKWLIGYYICFLEVSMDTREFM